MHRSGRGEGDGEETETRIHLFLGIFKGGEYLGKGKRKVMMVWWVVGRLRLYLPSWNKSLKHNPDSGLLR